VPERTGKSSGSPSCQLVDRNLIGGTTECTSTGGSIQPVQKRIEEPVPPTYLVFVLGLRLLVMLNPSVNDRVVGRMSSRESASSTSPIEAHSYQASLMHQPTDRVPHVRAQQETSSMRRSRSLLVGLQRNEARNVGGWVRKCGLRGLGWVLRPNRHRPPCARRVVGTRDLQRVENVTGGVPASHDIQASALLVFSVSGTPIYPSHWGVVLPALRMRKRIAKKRQRRDESCCLHDSLVHETVDGQGHDFRRFVEGHEPRFMVHHRTSEAVRRYDVVGLP
jgi:hypothetical protein